MTIKKNHVPAYLWGQNCIAWNMLADKDLSIKEELMPERTAEEMHKHELAQQFFYILEGNATFIIKDKKHEVKAGEGIHIPKNVFHQIKNETRVYLRFLVISSPAILNDKILFNHGN